MRISLLITGLVFLFIFAVACSVYAVIDPDSVVGMWLFDEGEGEIAADSSSHDNYGNISGAVWVDGKYGKALKFDGTDDYVDCGDDESLDLVDYLTLVAWVKHSAGNVGYFIIKNDSGDANRQYGFVDDTDNRFLTLWCQTPARQGINSPGGTSIDDDNWHHVAVSVDYPSVKFFIDGEEVITRELPDHMISIQTTTWIGKRKPNNYPLSGVLDEVAAFNVPLVEGDIKTIMDQGLESGVLAVVSPTGKLSTTWGDIKLQ